MDYLLPPDDFIRAVVELYYERMWGIEEIADKFEVGVELINRILIQYGKQTRQKPLKEIEDKRKKLAVKEMDDVARRALDKLTQDDLDDLNIDLGLFGQGHEPE